MNSALFVYEGNSFSFVITAHDPDGDPLTYSASDLPGTWAYFDENTHTLYGTAPYWSDIDSIRETQPGIFDITISVTDGEYTVERVVTLHVLDSLWTDKTIQELVSERPVEPQNSTIGTPVNINIISDQIIWTDYGGGKNIRKITFGFKSQTPTLDSCQDDWVSSTNFAYLPVDTPSVYNAGGLVEGDYSQTFGEDTLGEKVCAELDIPILVNDRSWYWDYGVELMDKYQDIAFQTRDPHYLFYVFTSSHFMRSIDALITVIDSLTNWPVSFSNFKAVLTGHSKFGHTCYIAAALDDRVVGIVPSGASILESGGARLLGNIQGAAGTKPDAFFDYKGLMMRKYIESIEVEPQIDTSVFIMQILGTDDDKSRMTGYTPKYVLLESTNHLTHNFRTGCIPNAPHTTQTTFHEIYWRMTLAHCFLNRELSTIDTVYHYFDNNNLMVEAKISGNNTIQNVKVWATTQSDMDTSAWNGYNEYNMTLSGGVYQAQIPPSSTAYFIQLIDMGDSISGVITSQPTPVNRNYPKLFLPPGNVQNLSVNSTGNDVNISWNNPLSSDFVGSVIIYSASEYPEKPTDGTLIFDGNSTQYTHQITDSLQTCYYTIFCYDSVGNYSSGIKFSNNVSSISNINNDETMLNIYPNPSYGITYIDYNCPETGYTEISIFDISGKKVKTLFSGIQKNGKNILVWDGKDDYGNRVITGNYFIFIKTKNYSKLKKIICF